MSEKNKEIIEKVNATFAEGNTEGFLSFCAEDVEWGMVGEKTFQGKQAIREFMSAHSGEAPEFTVDQIIAEGDTVVCSGDMTMKENGEPVSYTYCDIYELRNEAITRLQSFVVRHKTEGESGQNASA